jgi:hypothetical protein
MPRSTTTPRPTRRSAKQPSIATQETNAAPLKKRTTSTPARTGRKTIRANQSDPAALEGPAGGVRIPADPQRLSKLDQLVALLRRPDGASLSELADATGWQAHSIRGAIAGSLKRKGHVVTSEKSDGIRRYRIEAMP